MTLPNEVTDEIVAALSSKYSGQMTGEIFTVGGRFEPGFLHLDVTLSRRDGTWQYAMQFRVALAENRIGQAEGLDLAIDFAGWYLDQYFESGRELLLPLDFQPYNLGENVVYACGDIDLPDLKRMADEILERGTRCE